MKMMNIWQQWDKNWWSSSQKTRSGISKRKQI